MKSVYIDCNILIDWLLDREPFSTFSAKIIELTETKKIKSYVSPLTLANTYYIIQKELNKRIADEFIKDSISLFEILSITKENVIYAINNKFNDFEDDLHTAIAEKNKLSYIVTRNKKDFESSKIDIVDAEELLRIIEE